MPPAAPLRSPLRVVAALLGLCAAAAPAFAEAPRVRVVSAKVGLPPAGPDADAPHVSKPGAWAPVYLTLELLGEVTEAVEVVVEAPDAEGTTTTLALPLGPAFAGVPAGTQIGPGALGATPYVRPTGVGEVVVTVRAKSGVPLSEPFRVTETGTDVRGARDYVVLGLNTRLPGFDLPKPAGPGGATPRPRVRVAAVDHPGFFPDHWIGYDAADLVVLTSGGPQGLETLLTLFDAPPPGGRKQLTALREWVSRGGRLVVSVGEFAKYLDKMPALRDLLPAVVPAAAPTRSAPRLELTWTGREQLARAGVLTPRSGDIVTANLTQNPARPGRVVVPPPNRQGPGQHIVAVQGSFGLGRVTVIGFDLDRPPFTDFPLKDEFWDWVVREGGAARAAVGPGPAVRLTGDPHEEDELAVALRAHLDTFEDVPVVSFGWVAVLIAGYLLLVGPVEYVLLKRLFGRLELTWLTFPVIVLSVCAAAYLAAVSVKGRELKVNKVDVVDVDAGSGAVYGTTWAAAFSPRIDTYTAAVTPGEGWAAADNFRTVIAAAGRPTGARTGLVRRRYGYHCDRGAVADALVDVPIQVWSTRSFAANWAAPAEKTPAVVSHLVHPPGDPLWVSGSVTNRLPVEELTDCVLFYAGQAYPVPGGTVVRGDRLPVVLDRQRGVPASKWLQDHGRLDELLSRAAAFSDSGPRGGQGGPANAAPAPAGAAIPLWGVLFHEAAMRNEEGVYPRNASLRRLDQSWRLTPDNRDEVILVGRVGPPAGPAEDVLSGPASPSRLWLKGLPGAGPRPPIPGGGRQETYVRLYLPVRPAGAP